MRIRLDYGREGLQAELPDRNLVAVLGLIPAPPVEEPRAAVTEGLRHPLGAPPLRDLARGRRDACIVVCDATRPVPNPVLLPPVLEEMESAGIPRDRVTILIATGTHRPCTPEEVRQMLDPETARSCRIVNHVCTDGGSLADLGRTTNGVPVRLNRAYVEAAFRMTVGLIEPHFMAGYSGGRKLIMPGIAGLESVQAWHSPRFLEHPRSASGVVEGNPVHEEALAIARLAPPDLILDVTLDERNRITGVFAGDLEAAWKAGVHFADRHVRAAIPEPVDIVVTTCAGHPLDATFYQAVKGMVGALPIVKSGGSIVIAAQCAEGVGSAAFERTLLEVQDLERFVQEIQRPDWRFVADQWEVEELARAVRHAAVWCVAEGIPRDKLARLHVAPAATVEEGVAAALERHGPDATLAAIPRGPYVIPCVA